MGKSYSCHSNTTWQPYGYVISLPCADPNASCMVSMWQLYGLAIWMPYAYHIPGIWLCHMPAVWMPYRRHMAKPYVFCMASIQQAYYFVIWLNHIAATWIPDTTRFKDRAQNLSRNLWQSIACSPPGLAVKSHMSGTAYFNFGMVCSVQLSMSVINRRRSSVDVDGTWRRRQVLSITGLQLLLVCRTWRRWTCCGQLVSPEFSDSSRKCPSILKIDYPNCL